MGAKPSRQSSLERLTRLRRLRDVFSFAQITVICLMMYGFYWSATAGPFHKVIFEGSFFNRAAFALLVIITPALIIEAFPAPFTHRSAAQSAQEWLLAERVKAATMVVAAGILANKLLFVPTGNPTQQTIGKIVLFLCVAYAGWILRRSQGAMWRRYWDRLKGKEKGRGWAAVKEFIHQRRISSNPSETVSETPRLKQDDCKKYPPQ